MISVNLKNNKLVGSTINKMILFIIKEYIKNKSHLDYTIKEEGPNKGQFGYYINKKMGSFIEKMLNHNIKSVMDLGAGYGHFVAVASKFLDYSCGIEIEEELISKSRLTRDIEHKDIFDLTKEDVKEIEALYFYEPFHSKDLSEKFVEHLMLIMYEGQKIFYRTSNENDFSSYTYRFLDKKVKEGKLFKYEYNNSVLIYKKIQNHAL